MQLIPALFFFSCSVNVLKGAAKLSVFFGLTQVLPCYYPMINTSACVVSVSDPTGSTLLFSFIIFVKSGGCVVRV